MAYPPPPDDAGRHALLRGLLDLSAHAIEVQKTQGVMLLSAQAQAYWEEAYSTFTQETRRAPKAVAAIMVRVPVQVMKWALLYAVQAGHAQIEHDDLARAAIVGTYLMETARLVPGHVAKAQVARIEERVVNALARSPQGHMSVSEIHRLVGGRVKADELKRSLRSLADLGVLEADEDSSGRLLYKAVPHAALTGVTQV